MNIKYRINGEPAEVCYYESSEECPEFPMVEIRSRFGIRRYESLLEGVVYPAVSDDWDEEMEAEFPMELEGAFLLFANAVIAGMAEYCSCCSDELKIDIQSTGHELLRVKFSAMVDEDRPEIGYLSSILLEGDKPAGIPAFPLYDLSFAQNDGFSVIEELGVCVENEYLTEGLVHGGFFKEEITEQIKELIESMRSLASEIGPVSPFIKRNFIDEIAGMAVRVSFEELPDDAVIGSFE